MKQNVYLMLSALLISILFDGCGPKIEEFEAYCVKHPVYEFQTQEVKVPVMCKISNVQCRQSGAGLDPISAMLECISEHNENLRIHNKYAKDCNGIR